RHLHHPSTSALFPYTTLFRSQAFLIDETFLVVPEQAIPPALIRASSTSFPAIEPSLRCLCARHNVSRRMLKSDSSNAPSVVPGQDRKSTRLNSSHRTISYAVF